MKSMKGRIIRKLKSIPTITSLRQGLLFRDNPANQNLQTSPFLREREIESSLSALVGHSISVHETRKDDHGEEIVLGYPGKDKTEFRPPVNSEDKLAINDNEDTGNTLEYGKENSACSLSLSEKVQLLDESQSHRVQHDPSDETGLSALHLLNTKTESLPESTPPACFKLTAMEECTKSEAKECEEIASLGAFEEKCPPGGSESIVFYTTSLRGIRKTFEDCNRIRFLLESFRVAYDERDVSIHLEYKEELWRTLGSRTVPPRLFIRGRHIGGANEVVGLHEQGILRKLLQGIPLTPSNRPCSGCAGVRFVLCFNCNGSRKIKQEGQVSIDQPARCLECNENGLVKCPICSLK